MTPGEPAIRSLAGRAGLPLLLLIGLTAVIQTLSHLVPQLLRDDLYSGDAQQHVWWLYRFVDPTLFPNDPIVDYYSLSIFSTPGYQLIMRGLSHVLDLQHAAEWLSIVLALIAIALTAWLGAGIGKKTGAAAALSAYILCNSYRLVEGGYPRSFGLVFLLAGMIAICQRRWVMLGVVFAVTPLFYSPTVLNLVPAAAAVLGLGIYQHRRLPRGFAAMFILGLVGVVLIALIYLRPIPPEIGPWFTLAEGRKLPEMRPGGRTAFFRAWDTFYFASPVSGIGLTPRQAATALIVTIAAFVWRPRAVPLAGWALLAGALGMFAAAHAVLFKLYLPSRYTSYAFPLFAMIAAAAYAREFKIFILARHRQWSRYVRPALTVGACAFSLLIIRSAARDASAAMAAPAYGRATEGLEPVLVYLRTLPRDTLIASHPEDANPIPLRTQRSVLTNTETTIAFNKAYYLRMRQRLASCFEMLYASDWATIDRVANEYGVREFVVDRRRLKAPDERPYFKPFVGRNAVLIEAGKAKGFAMLSPPADRILFESGEWAVLRVGGGQP